MSQEKVLKTLQSMGLAESEAQVYVYLGKRGPQKAKDITYALKIPKQHLYPALKNLQGKGIVNATLERPARFSAVPFEKILDLFVRVKMEEANQIRQGKEEILSDWHSISISEAADHSPKFTVLEGRNFIYPRLKQMIEETKNQLSLILTVSSLLRADQAGLLDIALRRASKSKAEVRFLTEVSKQNVSAAKSFLNRTEKAKLSFEGRAPALEPKPFTRMIIRDGEEAVFFITSTEPNGLEDKGDLCLWTNCKPLVQSFATVFEELWLNSTDIKEKISEIETGIPTPKTCVISEAKTAAKKYDETLRGAIKEIVMMTSSKELLHLSRKMSLLKDLINRGVSIRIMAPIVAENLEAAHLLMKQCEVRHVPTVYLESTIVDGTHFFQFRSPTSNPTDSELLDYFENTFYTNDFEYVKRMENMLNDVWANSQVPSHIALKAIIPQQLSVDGTSTENIFDEYKKEYKKILGFRYLKEPQQGRITEKEILDKIVNAKRIPAKDPEKDTIMFYGTTGSAIIYPPENLSLPVFIIQVNYYNERSSFGAGSSLMIDIQMKIAENESYMQAVLATNSLQGYKFRKAMHSRLPTIEIVQLLKKDELKVHVKGDKLFAGWTVPIPLLPPKYILPPGCLTIEGYGKTKTYTSEIRGPMNRRVSYEFTSLDAFVTFMHPSSNYHGPGTDAMLHRDIITTSRPPSAWKETDISAQGAST